MDPTRNRAAIYCRISRDEAGTGQKVEDQERDCRELADRLGLTVVEVYADNDAPATRSSSRYRPRQRWNDLLAAIRAGQVDAILLTETARLQREMRDLLDLIEACERRDVPIHTVRQGQYDLTTSAGKMVAKILTAKDEQEVEQMRERLRAARLHKVGRGEWVGGRRPFGYGADGVTVVPAERDAVAWAASEILAGTSLNAVCTGLNEQGIRTSTGREWKPTELRRVLVRPRNAGLVQHRECGERQRPGEHYHTDDCWRIVGRAAWPPLLDEDVWRGVCAVLGDPARRTNKGTARRYLLAGIAVCGICGSPVKSFSASARRRPVRPVYTCRAAGSSSGHVIRTAEEVDRFVEDVVVGVLRERGAELLAPDQTGDATALHLRDAALAARLAELGRLAGDLAIDPITIVEATAEIKRQREQISDELAAMTSGSVLAGVADAADPGKAWAGLDLSRRREIVRVLMTVTILPAAKGRRPGWRPGESYFDPDTVRIEPKR